MKTMRQLLAKVRQKTGMSTLYTFTDPLKNGGKRTSLVLSDSTKHEKYVKSIKKQFSKIGVNVIVKVVDRPTYGYRNPGKKISIYRDAEAIALMSKSE